MPVLRSASAALAAALADGGTPPKFMADLFTFTMVDGITIFRFARWDSDLVIGGNTYVSAKPWLSCGDCNFANTMEIPTLTVNLRALNAAWNGGAQIKTQIHNGLFDGTGFDLSQVFMPTPGDVTTLGTVDIFIGIVAGVSIVGTGADITVKGKNNKLAQYAPHNLYQIGCNHAFCDAGCTLSRASFTNSFTVGSSPTPSRSFIPWASAPGSPGVYLAGTVTMTSGAAAGQSRTVSGATSSGLSFAYPLYLAPSAGDTFTAFQGCDKTLDSESGQSCTDYANVQNYRGFPYVPPPNSAY